MEAVSISSKKTKIYMKNHIKALADKIKRLESKITLHSSNKNNATLMIRKKQIEDSLRELRIYQRALSIYTRNEAETRLKKLKKLRPTQSSKKDEMSKEKKAQNNLEADNENNFNNTNKERKKEDNENNGKLKYIKEQSSQPLFSSTIDHKNQIEQMLDGDIKQMLDSDYSEEKIAKNVYNNYDKIAIKTKILTLKNKRNHHGSDKDNAQLQIYKKALNMHSQNELQNKIDKVKESIKKISSTRQRQKL